MILGIERPTFALAQNIHAHVRGDGEDPGLQAGFALEGADLIEGAHEDIMRQIFRILTIRQQPEGIGFQLGLKRGKKAVEGVDVAVLRPLNEL